MASQMLRTKTIDLDELELFYRHHPYLVKRLLYLEGALPETKSKLKHLADEHGFDDLLTYL